MSVRDLTDYSNRHAVPVRLGYRLRGCIPTVPAHNHLLPTRALTDMLTRWQTAGEADPHRVCQM